MGATVWHTMANMHVSKTGILCPCPPYGRRDSTVIQLDCPLCYQFQLFLPAGFRFQLFQQSLVNTPECQIKETTCGSQNIPNCPQVYTSRLLRNLLPLGALASGHCSLGQEESLDEGMATHSSILSRRIPWTEEPGVLPYIELYTTKPLSRAQHSTLPCGQAVSRNPQPPELPARSTLKCILVPS